MRPFHEEAVLFLASLFLCLAMPAWFAAGLVAAGVFR